LPGCFFSTSPSSDAIWVHLYDNCRLDWRVKDGGVVALIQETRYPWDGMVRIRLGCPEEGATFKLHPRIPCWCADARVRVNGEEVHEAAVPGTYFRIQRHWHQDDVVELDLGMPAVHVLANPRVADYRDKVALMRGPLVYCFEGADNRSTDVCQIQLRAPGGSSSGNLYEAVGQADDFAPEQRPDLLDGVVALSRKASPPDPALVAIPYYAWSNRGPDPMRIWVGKKPASSSVAE
jgi:uncharacterized protein